MKSSKINTCIYGRLIFLNMLRKCNVENKHMVLGWLDTHKGGKLIPALISLLWTESCPPHYPPKIVYVEALIINVMVFGNGTFEDNSVEMRSWEWDLHDRINVLLRKTPENLFSFCFLSCEDTGRWPSISQEESPHQKWTLSAPWSWTSTVQSCEKINFCSLSHFCLWHFVVSAQADRSHLHTSTWIWT